MFYIKAKDDIITGFFCGIPEDNDFIPVQEYFEGKAGDKLSDFKIDSLENMVKSGLIPLKSDEKILNNKIVKKTLAEQVADGLIELDSNYKIINGNDIVEKSLDELYSDKSISLSEYKEKKASIIRSERNSIINSLSWIRQRHIDEQLIGNTTLTEEQYKIYLTYIQDLRDITKQKNFPVECIWPIQPDYI